MLDLFGWNLYAWIFSPAFAQIVVSRKRVKRERNSIQMILQIENARETRASKFILVPGSVGVLMRNEPRHGAFGREILRPSRRQQTDQPPGSL